MRHAQSVEKIFLQLKNIQREFRPVEVHPQEQKGQSWMPYPHPEIYKKTSLKCGNDSVPVKCPILFVIFIFLQKEPIVQA